MPRETALPPFITATELRAVKRHMLLGIALTVMDRDKKAIAASAVKTPKPYIDLIDRAMDVATVEVRDIRQSFRTAGIKLFNDYRYDNGHQCEYVCRGYTGKLMLLDNTLAAEIEVLKRRLIGEDISKYVDPTIPERLRH